MRHHFAEIFLIPKFSFTICRTVSLFILGSSAITLTPTFRSERTKLHVLSTFAAVFRFCLPTSCIIQHIFSPFIKKHIIQQGFQGVRMIQRFLGEVWKLQRHDRTYLTSSILLEIDETTIIFMIVWTNKLNQTKNIFHFFMHVFISTCP